MIRRIERKKALGVPRGCEYLGRILDADVFVTRRMADQKRLLQLRQTIEDILLGDIVEDSRSPSPFEGAAQARLADQTERLLETLAPREARVLRMRFGFGDKGEHTLEEVGAQFSVTRERIRQIEARALDRLRHGGRSEHLKSFIKT